MTPTFSGAIQAGWGRVAGAFCGGLTAALTLTSLGDNPVVAGLSYIVTLLLIEMLQWQASSLSATLLFPLLFVDQAHGQYPWQYIYDRVRYNFIGVFIGTLIMFFLWRDKPRETLSNHLMQILGDSDQGFRAIVFGHLQGELPSAEIEKHLKQMKTLIQESQSLLEESSYGVAGDLFIQDNWSELIAIQWRLVRYLYMMGQTPSSKTENFLWQQFTAPLTHLVEQVSEVCTTLTSLVPSRRANQSEFDIPFLSRDVSEITEQLKELRTTQEFLALPLSDILRFYAVLDALTHFTQELQQLAPHLRACQTVNRQKRRVQLSFKLHPVEGDNVKKYLKGGLALGIVLAFEKYFNLFDINRWAIFFAIITMTLIQNTWGMTKDRARTILLCLFVTLFSCYLVMKTLGNSAMMIAVVLFMLSYFCLSLKLVTGFQLSIKLGSVFLLTLSPNSPTLYVDFWNIFKNALAAAGLAFLLSRLFWPTYTTQNVEHSISQTFTKLGQFY